MAERKYLLTLADLVDRLTIVNQKLIFIKDRRAEYLAERELILHDIDVVLQESDVRLDAKAVLAISMIQLANREIWLNESKAREGGPEQNDRLRFTHSINGVRNGAKNMLSDVIGGRKDYKVDALAADLPTEFGNWDVLK